MRHTAIVVLILFLAGAASFSFAQQAPHPSTYIPTLAAVEQHKKFFDDPRPYLTTFGPRQVLPAALYASLAYDREKMQALWRELVGFSAPDEVGKIAPEIKPGTYTCKDLEKYPGFKELLYPDLYKRIKTGGPPHAGCIPEFEIIPTRQYYWALPVAEATKKNLGKTQLDAGGYLLPETWAAGYPFPRPAGPFKAQQIMYNVEKRYLAFGLNFYMITRGIGFTGSLTRDFDSVFSVSHIPLAGRVLMEPLGWFDEGARARGESRCYIVHPQAPRDISGMVQYSILYLDPEKADQNMIYLPSLRRVRKMTGTDTQDPVAGQDVIYDDNEGWMQKLSPSRYPYRFEVLAEREYLVVAPTLDGAEYWGSAGLECRNVRLERRPVYVVKLTQLDPNYVYSYRIFYIDKETFNFYHTENYDQKGRLYRTFDVNYSWFPDMGAFSWCGSFVLMRDHIDLHSCIEFPYQLPAFWGRDDLGLKAMMEKGK